MRILPRTAAYRIAFLSAMIFVLSTIAIGFAVLYAVHHAFQRQLEDSILEASNSLQAEFVDDGASGITQAIAVRQASTSSVLGFALFDRAGQRIAGQMDTPMPPPGWHRIVFRDPVEGPDRAMALATALANGNRLVVAADLEPVERMDRKILLVFAFGCAGALLLGMVFAFVLGQYLKRRLDAIAKGSIAFAAGDYSGRAEVGPSGDEFDNLAASLNAMLDRIEALLRNLRQVTSDLAHDLRTPLTRLHSQLERLRTAPESEREELTEAAIEKGDEILQMFAAILRISELEGGELHRHFRTLDLGALANEIFEAHEPLAEDSRHLLLVDAPVPIHVIGDRELLAQAMINLVENALRHTPSGSRIEIGAACVGDRPMLFVRDNGPGIPEQDRERATERFVRLEAERSTPGNGLGLSLVRAIAEAHGAILELSDASPGLMARIIFDKGIS